MPQVKAFSAFPRVRRGESGLAETIPSVRPSPLWATSLCSPGLSTLGPHQLAISAAQPP